MTYKRTWFSWINFFIATGFMSVMLFTFFILVFGFIPELSQNLLYVFSALAVVLLFGFFFLLSFIKKKITVKTNKTIRIISYVLYGVIVAGLTGFIAYKYYLTFNGLLDGTVVYGKSDYLLSVTDSIFYRTGLVKCDTISFMYCSVIAFIFKLYGINLAYVGIFEGILFFASAVMLYFSVLMLAGKIPALSGYAFLLFLYDYYFPGHEMSAYSLLFFIGSFFCLIFSLVCKDRAKGKMNTNLNVMLFILLGCMFGFLLYLDLSTVYLVLMAVYFLCSNIPVNFESRAINRRVLPTIVFLVSCLAFFAGTVLLDSYLSGVSIIEQGLVILSKFTSIDTVKILLPTEYILECIIVFCFCLFGCLGYLTKDKEDKYGFLFFAFILLVSFTILGDFKPNIASVSSLFYGIIFGTGINELFFYGYRKATATDDGEIIILSESDEPVQIENEDLAVPSAKTTTETETFSKTAFIDNPIKLPKKHVKKTMGYDFEPDEDQMKFDIDISDNDDFDV